MEQVGKLKLYTLDECADAWFGLKGTPERDRVDAEIKQEIEAELQRREETRQRRNRRRRELYAQRKSAVAEAQPVTARPAQTGAFTSAPVFPTANSVAV